MESNGPDSGWEWGEQARAWVRWAVTENAVTIAQAATVWGYDEEQAARWIAEWASQRGWAEELRTEGVDHVWRMLCAESSADLWADAQVVAGLEQLGPPEPGGPSHDEMVAGLAGDTPVEDLAVQWRRAVAQVSWAWPAEPPAEQVRAQLRILPSEAGPRTDHPVPAMPMPSFTEPQREVLGALRHLERPTLTVLARTLHVGPHVVRGRLETIGTKLDIEGAAAQILAALIPRLGLDGDLAGLELPWPPAVPVPAATSPVRMDFTPEQTRMLATVRDLVSPTMHNLAKVLRLRKQTLADRLEAIGREAGVEGTATEILTTLISRVRPPGDLAQLVSSWPSAMPVPFAESAVIQGDGPSEQEILGGLTGETSVEDLAIRWGLTVREVVDWAGRLALQWWGWSITTPVEQVRARLRAAPREGRPEISRAAMATPLPTFTERQRQVLAALRHLERPNMADLVTALRIALPTVRSRLAAIGEDLGIEGTPTRILHSLVPRVRPGGDLAGLELYWPPVVPVPSVAETFTLEQTWVLAAVRGLEPPTRPAIATAVGLTESAVRSRLEAIGLILAIDGTASEILATLVSRLGREGDLAELDLPRLPTDGPVLGQGNRKRGRRNESRHSDVSGRIRHVRSVRTEAHDDWQTAAWPEQHTPAPMPGLSAADVEEILSGGTDQESPLGGTDRPVQHDRPAGTEQSTGDIEEIIAGGAGGGPSQEEMLAGLTGETAVEDLAAHWRLTVPQVIGWAGQLAQASWDWSITTPVEQVRAQLRSPTREIGPETGQTPPTTPLPKLTESQLRVLSALAHQKRPTVSAIATALGLPRQTVATRFMSIGEDLGIEGTPAQILTALIPRLRPGGDLVGLELSSRPVPAPPTEVIFTPEQTRILAAMKHLERPSRYTIANALGVPHQTVGGRLEAIGRDLGIRGTATQILDTLVPRVRQGGDLAGLELPWPPPDRPLPSAETFTREQILVLAAVRDLKAHTRIAIATALGVTEPAARSQLDAIGRILGIEGGAVQILTSLAPRVRPGGDLAGLVPSLPPDPPVLGEDTEGRKAQRPDESPHRPSASDQ